MKVISYISFFIFPLVTSGLALGHHSFSAEFDVGRTVDITGKINKIEWTNPHAWIYLSVSDSDGDVEEWAVELLGINTLVRSGMTPKSVVAGDAIRVTGFGSRDGTNTANASSVSRESGESLWKSARE